MKVFIGSSREAQRAGTLDKICLWVEELGHQPLRWDASESFTPGSYTLARLQQLAATAGAAIFILSEDDKTWYRGESLSSPRDNVVLELGIFIGRLDHGRAVLCRAGRPKIATDLDGVIYIDMARESKAKIDLREWFAAVVKAASTPSTKQITCHTNKYAMNDSNVFWHHFRADAHSELVILGDTNKSWISRDPTETEQFAQQIIDFCLTSSRCALVSGPKGESLTKRFFRTHVIPTANKYDKRLRLRIKKRLPAYFSYGVTDHITYKAVLSDDRLAILPNTAAKEFREESMVLEMTKSTHPVEFGYYAQDIRRKVAESARPELLKELVGEIHG